MNDTSIMVFDRQSVRRHRDRAAPAFRDHDFLFAEAADRLAERLEDVKRDFPLALDLGSRDGLVDRFIGRRGGIADLIQADLSPAMLGRGKGMRVVMDDEFLPFGENTFDLVISCLNLHWVNDLPGALLQIHRALKPGGLFLASVFGGATLQELRSCLAETEIELEGGLSPRCSPLIGVQDAGALMQRAGFVEPVIDTEFVDVSYGQPIRLLYDLRGMGETNAVIERRKTMTRRQTLFGALNRYVEQFGNADGRVPATFEIVTMTAWKAES